MGELRDRRMV